MHTEHARIDTLIGQTLRGLDRVMKHRSAGDERDIAALTHLDCLSQLEIHHVRRVDPGLSRLPQPQVGGTGLFGQSPRGQRRLNRITRSHGRHARQGPHDGKVLGGMMGDAERAVIEPAAHADHHHARVVVTDVVADLLQATQGGEVGDGIGKDHFAAHRHTGRNRNQVLFRHADIQKAVGILLREGFDQAKPKVTHHKVDSLVVFSQIEQRMQECTSHSAASSSAMAFSNSSSLGGR